MRTALDAPSDRLDEEEREFVGAIREYGWYSTHVQGEADLPAFTYTTGFWVGLGAAEIILFALKFDTAASILADVYQELGEGRRYPVGTRLDDVFGNAPAYVFDVAKTHYAEHLGWNQWFYRGDDFPCQQLVWPDRAGRFPWEAGFDEALRANQPDLSARGWARELRG